MLTILWTGGTLVFGNIHISTASHFKAMGIRHLAVSIAQLASWAKVASQNPDFFRSVEAVTTGGARLSPNLAELVRRDICKEIYINYGSTETGLIAAGNADIFDRHPDAVGVVLDTATVEVVDADGNVLPSGETGSVRVRTGAMSGVAGTGDTEQRWFFTGDSGALSEDGTLSIFGRNDGVMNFEGLKIRLEDAEQQLSECPGVADVALFTIQNEIGLSEFYCAFVPENGFSDDVFSERLRQLPKIHATLELKAIPRGGNGKVLRHELVSIFLDMKKRLAL
jgi:acyl-coenzyme A synthetase/AMP-(fatty) acid ligase